MTLPAIAIDLMDPTRLALKTLLQALETPAARHPADAVPPGLVADARFVLGDVRRILSREPVAQRPFILNAPLTYAELAAKLHLAFAALNELRAQHEIFAEFDEDRRIDWHARAAAAEESEDEEEEDA